MLKIYSLLLSSLSSFAANVNSALGSNYNDSIKASVVFLAQQEQNLQGFNYNYYGVQTDLKWSGIDSLHKWKF